MLKRELKFSTFLLPVMVVSFFPHIGFAVETAQQQIKNSQNKLTLEQGDRTVTLDASSEQPASTGDLVQVIQTPDAGPAPASVTVTPQVRSPVKTDATVPSNFTFSFAGKTYKASEVGAATSPAQPNQQQSVTSTTPATEIPGMLNAEDLAGAGVSMSIKVTGKQATLEGWIASDCAQDVEVYTTDQPYPLLYSDAGDVKSVGFAIHSNGKFLACMKKPENNCSISRNCVSLSTKTTPYQVDGKDHIKLAYLNSKSGNVQAANIKVIGQAEWLTDEANQQAADRARQTREAASEKARQAAQKANLNNLTTCIKKASNPEDLAALKLLITPDYFSDGDQNKIGDLIIKREKELEKADLKVLESSISKLLKASKTTSATIKSKRKKDDDDDDTDTVADNITKLEDKVYDYAGQLDTLKADGKIEDDEYEKQEAVLANAIQNLIKLTVTNDPTPEGYDNAREMLAKALGDGDDDSEAGVLHPSSKIERKLEAIDPLLVRGKIGVEVKACMEEERGLARIKKSDCDEANSDYESLLKKLTKEDKGCDGKKLSKEDKADCKETEKELEALKEVPAYEANDVQNEYSTALANLQKNRQGGLAGLNQNPAANQFANSPTVMNFANAGIPVTGAPGSFGVNQLASLNQPGLPYASPLYNNPLQPYSAFNGYRGF